jgi:hypothetical protein
VCSLLMLQLNVSSVTVMAISQGLTLCFWAMPVVSREVPSAMFRSCSNSMA